MRGLPPAARALVRAAKEREAPLPETTRARVHQSVLRRAAALGGAAAAVGSAGMTAKASALGGGIVLSVVAPVIFGGLAGAALIVATGAMRQPDMRAPPVPAVPVAAPAPRETSPVVSAAPWRVEPSPSGVPAEVFSGRRAPAKPSPPLAPPTTITTNPRPAPPLPGTAPPAVLVPPAPAGATTRAEPVDDLAAQVELLRQAHAALRAGQPEQALLLLDRNGAALGSSPLAEEAGAARISALCRLGRESDARSAIGSFLSAWPRSPLSLKIQGGCAALLGEKR